MTTTASPAVGLLALTEAQEGLWFAQQRDPGNPVFNTGQYVELSGPLDVPAFAAAVDRAMTEATALAMRIVATNDGPRQRHDARLRATLECVDCRHATDPDTTARQAMAVDMATAIDLSIAPAAAQRLFVVGNQRYFWYQRVHHVAIDGYGTTLLTRRICDLYRAAVSGSEPATLPFADFQRLLDADQAYRQSRQRQDDRQYWLEAFASPVEVAGLADGPAITAGRYLSHALDLPKDLGARLQRTATAAGVGWPDVLTALVCAYLQRHIGGREAVVGVPAMLRVGTAAARIPAMVMNVLPLRVSLDESAPLASVYSAVATRLRRARQHGAYRGEQLRRDLDLLRDGRRLHGPLINILPFDAPITLPGLRASLRVLGTGPVDDLTVTIRSEASAMHVALELDANPRLYDAGTLARHALRLAAFINRALDAGALSDVPTVTEAERREVIDDFNATARPVEVTTLTALIERAMRRWPKSPALVAGGVTLTYAELDTRSLEWAQRLAEFGVGRGDFVAVAVPRSIELEVALVAVLRAGAAYLPIDPDYPPERVHAIFSAARPAAVLAVGETSRAWPLATRELRLDQPMPAAAIAAAVTPPSAGDPAYLIFTSGSTGTPKGVVIQHEAIVNRLEWMRAHYAISQDDRILQKTPATFDVSVWEFFLPLIAGATLVMAPPEAHRDPAWLVGLIAEHRITTVHFVPSMLAQFLAEPSAQGLALRRVFCSGEALPAALRDRCHETLRAELHNLYGPTEAAVDVTFWDASAGDQSSPVPIGFPVWNTRLYILDARRRPLPVGAPGDLYIAGVQLAREYISRPDLTSERFVADPFHDGERMYLTGDVARWRADGAIEYLGRSDFQVKLRGLRIELGEIEAVLASHPQVADVAVVVREDRPGDQRLVAYLVGHDAVSDDVLQRARQMLPPYMVPSTVVWLDEFPLGATGKLDRGRLPAPSDRPAATGRAAESPTERALAGDFSALLGVATGVSAASDFFALGGHSLLAVQLVRRINDRWPIELTLGSVFERPSLEGLARLIDDRLADPQTATAVHGLNVMLKLSATSAPPTLYCVHPAGGLSWCYAPLARALSHWTTYGIQSRQLAGHGPPPASLLAIAEDYAAEIRRVQPRGPYHLIGWSVGGIIAHAVAEILERTDEIGTLAMLDAYPCDRWRDTPPPDEALALRALLLMAGLDPDRSVAQPPTRTAVMQTLRASEHPLGALPEHTIGGILRVVMHNSELVRGHHHRPVRCGILHFRAALEHVASDLSPLDWRPYVHGGIDVIDLPSMHAHLTTPAISALVAGHLQTRSTT